MTKNEEITEFMLTTLKDHGFEDTTENRLEFLLGLQKAWDEDEDDLDVNQRFEKALYRVALTGMISVLNLKVLLKR